MPYTYTLNALPEPWGGKDGRADDGGMMGRTWKKERRDERERERERKGEMD